MSDGTRLALPGVTLAPAGVATLNINDAVRNAPANLNAHRSEFGMAQVDYTWSWSGAVLASVQNIDETAMLSFHSPLQADMARFYPEDKAVAAQKLAGAWWRPYNSTNLSLFLGNTTEEPTDVALQINTASGKSVHSSSIHLLPHSSTKLDIFSLMPQQPGSGTTGSLSLSYSGTPYSLVAFAGLEDQTTGFSANLNLTEAHPEKARKKAVHDVSIAVPGVMIGPQNPKMQFPENTRFSPYLVLHNNARAERSVAVSAIYTASGFTGSVPVGTVSLTPGETTSVDFSKLTSAVRATDTGSLNLEATFTGNEGDIAPQVGAVDQTGNYVLETVPQIEAESASRTICYWTLAGDTNSMISLWNYTATAQDLVLTLYYEGGSYRVPVHLAAHADLDLDLASLAHSRLPDDQGNILPTNITEGSAILSGPQDTRQRFDIASAASTFNVRTATCTNQCGTCNGVTEDDVHPIAGAFSVVGLSMQFTAALTYNTGQVYNVTSGGGWTTGSNVASVTSSGMVTALRNGSTYTTSSIYDPVGLGNICMGNQLTCPYSTFTESAPTSVGPPSVSCTPATRGGTTTCTASGGSGIFNNWVFTDGTGFTVTSSTGTTSTTWSGTAVVSGTVSVTAGASDGSTSVASTPLVVTARSGWAFSPHPSTRVTTITNCLPPSIPNPPVPATSSSDTSHLTGAACPYVGGTNYTIGIGNRA